MGKVEYVHSGSIGEEIRCNTLHSSVRKVFKSTYMYIKDRYGTGNQRLSFSHAAARCALCSSISFHGYYVISINPSICQDIHTHAYSSL